VIVLDASAGVDLLLGIRPASTTVGDRLKTVDRIHVPALFDIEVLSGLRGHERAGGRSARVGEAVRELAALRAIRHPHELLRARSWALRERLSVYDAVYVALAELLDATLLTCDARLARARGHEARIELIAGG